MLELVLLSYVFFSGCEDVPVRKEGGRKLCCQLGVTKRRVVVLSWPRWSSLLLWNAKWQPGTSAASRRQGTNRHHPPSSQKSSSFMGRRGVLKLWKAWFKCINFAIADRLSSMSNWTVSRQFSLCLDSRGLILPILCASLLLLKMDRILYFQLSANVWLQSCSHASSLRLHAPSDIYLIWFVCKVPFRRTKLILTAVPETKTVEPKGAAKRTFYNLINQPRCIDCVWWNLQDEWEWHAHS